LFRPSNSITSNGTVLSAPLTFINLFKTQAGTVLKKESSFPSRIAGSQDRRITAHQINASKMTENLTMTQDEKLDHNDDTAELKGCSLNSNPKKKLGRERERQAVKTDATQNLCGGNDNTFSDPFICGGTWSSLLHNVGRRPKLDLNFGSMMRDLSVGLVSV
jgi:hypothetical protein